MGSAGERGRPLRPTVDVSAFLPGGTERRRPPARPVPPGPAPDTGGPTAPAAPRVEDFADDPERWTGRLALGALARPVAGAPHVRPSVTVEGRYVARMQWFRTLADVPGLVDGLAGVLDVYDATGAGAAIGWIGQAGQAWEAVAAGTAPMRALTLHPDGGCTAEAATVDLRPLRAALHGWAAPRHLADPWALDAALHVLAGWGARRMDAPGWRPAPTDFAYPRAWARVPGAVPASALERLPVPAVGDMLTMLQAEQAGHLLRPDADLRAAGWVDTARKRGRGDDTRALRAFRWLADYQVRGMRWAEIAAAQDDYTDADAVQKTATALAALLGPTLRASAAPGRPRTRK